MTKNSTLRKLRAFLEAEEPRHVEWLVKTWDSQINAITYRELREAVLSGGISLEQLEAWQEDYAILVDTKLTPQWIKAMATATHDRRYLYPGFLFEPYTAAVQNYVQLHGAELVTNLTNNQREALKNMIAQTSHINGMTPDKLSRLMRPVIGLTAPQAQANLKYWDRVLQTGIEAGLSNKAAEKRAYERAATYAERQHRYRAMSIARTELAAAYNHGAFSAIKEAQEKGYIGDVVKVWLTADDERVCKICIPLDGERVNVNAMFSAGELVPPAHPQCRCAVAYEEITKI